jgi:hypothetical protein
VVSIYAAGILVEAARHASRIADMPGVVLTLLMGNLVPGFGTLAQAIGLVGDRRKVYRNDR